MTKTCLNSINPGEQAEVVKLENTSSMRRRLLDMGIVKGTVIKCLMKSPCGDPTAYLVKRAVIAIRSEDAEKIIVQRGDV